MSEVRNALTKALADGLYLRLDTSNDPLLANLNLGQFDLLEVGKIEGGALVTDDLEIAAHSAERVNPATDGRILLKNFLTFSGITDFTSATTGNFQLFNWSETVDMSGQSVIIPQGFWYRPTFLFNTAQVFGSSSLINDASIWKETSLISGAHTAFAIGSFTSTIEYMVNHAGVGNPPSAIYGYNSAPAINAGTGSLTMPEMICYTTNLPSTLKVFLGVRSLENGAICTLYTHYQANSGNVSGILLEGGSIITTEVGLDLIDLNTGLTCITVRSNDINAYMEHAGHIQINSDNRGLYLGASLDVLLQYTGLVAYLDTGIIAPSDFIVDCGSEKTLVLQEVVWDDLRVPLTPGKLGVFNPPSFSKFMDNGAGSVGVYAPSFAYQAVVGNEEQMWFPAQLPHRYKQGSDIEVHIHWSPAVSGGANQFVKWGLEFTWINIDGTFGNTTIIYSDASSASTATTSGDSTLTAKKHYMTEIGTITGSGKNVSSMLQCRIFRNSSHAEDTLIQEAFGLEVDFHYQVDTMGSRQEYIK
jgi:hypothetical protein